MNFLLSSCDFGMLFHQKFAKISTNASKSNFFLLNFLSLSAISRCIFHAKFAKMP